MTTIEQQIRSQAAEEDYQVLIEESMMAVTGTKLGVIWLSTDLEAGELVATVDGQDVKRTDSHDDEEFRSWLSEQYIVEL